MTSTEYSKGYMAGLADAQKQAQYWSGKVALKKVRMVCPACKVESPMPDPDAELLEALKACALVCAGETLNKNSLVNALEKARAALAKFGVTA